METVEDVLSLFHIKALKPLQAQIITTCLNNQDALVIAATGFGKSICYQIPALLRQGTFIVVSPLIALMQDQVSKLKKQHIDAACLSSQLDPSEQQDIYARLQQQSIKILYLAPEKLFQPMILNLLQNMHISGFAIDEVHCMLQWGYEFRPEYQDLKNLKTLFPSTSIMALTATASVADEEKIIRALKLNGPSFRQAYDRHNIQYHILDYQNAYHKILELHQEHPQESGIIYVASRRRADAVYHYLCQQQLDVLRYHAGMSKEERQMAQTAFLNEDKLLVATLAFGMGIDKANVRYIIHLDIPANMQQLLQETGRCGRDGLPAQSYLLFKPASFLELNLWRIQQAASILFRDLMQELKLMIGLLTQGRCIHLLIGDYYGSSGHACQICQNCLDPQSRSVPEDEAKRLLSCIYWLKNDAKTKTIIDVLMGQGSLQYQTLSTFAIGQDQKPSFWYALLMELYYLDMIDIQSQTQMNWQLTRKAADFLRPC